MNHTLRCNSLFVIHCLIMFVVQVKLSFLPVGHTHEDIDQMFSRFSDHLVGRDIFCISDMKEKIEKAFTYRGQRVQVFTMQKVIV